MSKAPSVKYSVLAGSGADWAPYGETGDMSAALGAARNLLRSGQAAKVKVVKQFLDSASGRNVTTTILEEAAGRTSETPKQGAGAMRWLIIAGAMFLGGFGVVFLTKTYFL
jgi:hypothetical protein